jgi:hypothetical protein
MFNNSDIFAMQNLTTHLLNQSRCGKKNPDIRQVMIEILEGLRSVPSSANTQPWTIVVVQGAKEISWECAPRLSK